MTPFRILVTTALLLVKISAFSTTPAAAFGKSTALKAESSTPEESSDLDFKEQWNVDDSFTTTPSGLMFKDTVVGSGETPDDGGTIEIHYAFWFDAFEDENDKSGPMYFNTRNEKNVKNEPLGFQFGEKSSVQILKGWAEGMKTMKQGGSRVLIIPPKLGYGDKEVPANLPTFPAIPANSYLRFEIEMVTVDNSAWTKFRRMIPKPSGLLQA